MCIFPQSETWHCGVATKKKTKTANVWSYPQHPYRESGINWPELHASLWNNVISFHAGGSYRESYAAQTPEAAAAPLTDHIPSYCTRLFHRKTAALMSHALAPQHEHSFFTLVRYWPRYMDLKSPSNPGKDDTIPPHPATHKLECARPGTYRSEFHTGQATWLHIHTSDNCGDARCLRLCCGHGESADTRLQCDVLVCGVYDCGR